MKVLELCPGRGPAQWGQAHGEAFGGMIRDLAEIRLGLTVTIGGFESSEQVLDLAGRHLPVLERYEPDLYAELVGISEGSGVDPARLIVLNHYTDLRDLDPEVAHTPAEDDCSAVYARSPAGPLLGQTWDMHGSAHPYVMMLHVPAHRDRPAAWLFSITGCLGMTGMNAHGIGITINNLKSLDAKIGLVWPALVRRVLFERDVSRARDVVLDSPLGSGHHYLVASEHGAYGIETSGTREKIVFDGSEKSFVHTNHCVDEEMAALHTVGADSTTHLRYEALGKSVSERAIESRDDLWARLGSHVGYPKSICTHMATPERPHKMRTCGGLVMDLSGQQVWAAPGCLHEARPHVFGFEGT